VANKSGKPKNIRIHIKPLVFGCLYFFLVLFVAVGTVFAKYVREDENNGVVKTPNFYFESDILVENGTVYDLTPGTTSVSFYLNNYADSLRYSTDTIEYTVTTSAGTLTPNSGSIEGGKVGGALVTLSGLTDGGTYTVSAVGKAGFSRTLSATFKVKLSQPKAYKNVDDSNPAFVILTVWTEELDGVASITYPTGLIPDNTWDGMENVALNASRTFTTESFSKYSSKTYRFIKMAGYDKATAVYSVTFGGVEAEAKNLL
jgi:hypothetical protein